MEKWDGSAPRVRSDARTSDQFVVLDDRRRIVKVMEQPLPFLVLRRLAKDYCVVLDPFPLHEEHVLTAVNRNNNDCPSKASLMQTTRGQLSQPAFGSL